MDIKDFPLHFELIHHAGFSVGMEEQMILTWALRELHEKNSFDHTYFWGILFGERNNYYIAYGVRRDFVKGRTFFYSINCEEWVLLPQPEEKWMPLASTAATLFSGDPSLKLHIQDDEIIGGSSKKGEDDSVIRLRVNEILDEPELKEGEKSEESDEEGVLKEENRLSIIVHLITNESAVIPRGGCVKFLDGKYHLDNYFRGLNHEEALEFRSYFHYRIPRESWNTNLTQRTDSDHAIDVLDTIDDDIPKRKTWTIRRTSDNMIIIKNLKWQGMTFYHKLNTNIFGFVYFGNGKMNLDLPFML